MTRDELGKLYPIKVQPYNPDWNLYFEKEKELLRSLFSYDLIIEHIGSTAVARLAAKPTIDILIEKPTSVPDNILIETFDTNGYIHMQEQTNHLMFVKGYTPTGLEEISYHIHMGPLEQNWLWDRIYFRDYLNQNECYRKEYQELKYMLAKKYKNDREAYTNSKADFIKKVTVEAKNVLQ
jgi:GrpB-like predicted nucleotidyltransferase (UPF0157 family)